MYKIGEFSVLSKTTIKTFSNIYRFGVICVVLFEPYRVVLFNMLVPKNFIKSPRNWPTSVNIFNSEILDFASNKSLILSK